MLLYFCALSKCTICIPLTCQNREEIKKGKKTCICHMLLLHRETPGSAMCKIDWMKKWWTYNVCQEHTLWCINESVSMVIALTQFYTRVVCIALTKWYEKHVRYSNHQQNIKTNHLKLAITITTRIAAAIFTDASGF